MFYQFLKIALRNIKRDWSYFLVITLCLAAGLTINAVMTVQEDRYYQTRYPGSDRTYSTELTVPDSIKEKQKAVASDFGAFMQAYNRNVATFGPQVFDATCFYVDGVEDIVLQDSRDEFVNETGLMFHAAGKDIPYYYKSGMMAKQRCVSDSYYKYRNLTLMMGDRMPSNESEIIIKESILKRIGLDINEIGSYTVEPILSDYSHSGREYRIVNVIKDDKWAFEEQFVCFHWLDVTRVNEVYTPVVILSPGVDKETVNERLKVKHFMNSWGEPKTPALTYPRYSDSGNQFVLTLLGLVVLAVVVVSFLKRLVQSVVQNKRAKQIHFCMGAGVWHIFALQMIEVLIMLLASTLLSIYISSILTEFLNVNRENYNLYHSLPMRDIAAIEAFSSAIILAICTAVVLVTAIWFVKRAFAAKRTSRKERHLVTNLIIGIELSVAVYGICQSLIFIGFSEKRYNPMPGDVSKRTYRLDLKDRSVIEQYVPVEELLRELSSIPQIEDVCRCASAGVGTLMSIGNSNTWLLQVDANYFKFFNIPCDRTGVPETGNEIYLSRRLYDNLLADGADVTQPLELNDPGVISFDMSGNIISHASRKYTVAGVYERNFGAVRKNEEVLDSKGDAITINNSVTNYLFVRFAPGISREKGQELVNEVVSGHLPETVELQLNDIETYSYQDDVKTSSSLYTAVAFICILLAVLSVKSSVSADAARRRKEVALRKINGAKARDIAGLFVRPYGIIVAIAFVAGYLFSVMPMVKASKEGSYIMLDSYVSWVLPASLAIIVMVVALTLLRRVRAIMRTNPADVIKSE
jgi:ABC-type lipoprotein release transport system permease subunit